MIVTQNTKNKFNKEALMLCILPTIAVLVAMLAVSGLVYANSLNAYKQDKNQAVNDKANRLGGLLINRLQAYEEILRGGAGLIESSPSVTRRQWQSLIDIYQPKERYPGIQALAYAPFIPNTDKDAVVTAIRQNDMPAFTVFPEAGGNDVAPILYIEPQTESNLGAIGFNIFGEANRSEAMLKSSETNTAVITSKVPARPGTLLSNAASFVMYFPVYDTSCTERAIKPNLCVVKGYTFAAFRFNNLISGILADDSLVQSTFKIYDGDDITSENLLYETGEYTPGRPTLTSTIKLYSRSWTVVIQQNASDVSETVRNRPTYILVSSLAITILAASTVFSTLLRRARKLRTSKDIEVQMVRDELLALAAHQLRTPATAVKQYIIMTLEGYGGKLKKEQAELITKAFESNERQLRTVNEILYVANADAGQLRLLQKETNLVNLIQEAVDEQKTHLEAKRHRVVLSLPSTPLHYKADELFMRMAIGNIISNAAKYTPEQGKISVSLKVNQKNIFIHIKDNGVGITKKQIPLLFKKFSRLDNSLSNQTMGSGLGLYLAKKLVMLHQGTINVTSSKKGSLFTIVLPRVRKDDTKVEDK